MDYLNYSLRYDFIIVPHLSSRHDSHVRSPVVIPQNVTFVGSAQNVTILKFNLPVLISLVLFLMVIIFIKEKKAARAARTCRSVKHHRKPKRPDFAVSTI